jgi:purine-nucleoside phosphorylase
MQLFDQITEAVAAVRQRTDFVPRMGIVLGTGLGRLVEDLDVVAEIAYGDLPHFAHSTVQSHAGKFVFGYLGGHPVVVMAGRLHWYEGWTMQQVTFPVRVMRALGCERLVVTNVSGGIQPHLQAGDLVIVRDHINLLPDNPLRGPNDERLGPRFPDLLHSYDADLRRMALDLAAQHGIRAREGVYSALSGPNLETPAEYALLRTLGSDCTGMSSVPEVLVARHGDMAVLMISLVSNVSFPPERIRVTTIDDVIAIAQQAEVGMRLIIKELAKKL